MDMYRRPFERPATVPDKQVLSKNMHSISYKITCAPSIDADQPVEKPAQSDQSS